MKKLGTIANAIGVAALAILPSFNAQAENTSGIHPARAYMGELSTAIVQVTQDVDDGARVGQFSQKLDSILAQGAIPVGQAFGIGNPDGSRTLYGFVGAK